VKRMLWVQLIFIVAILMSGCGTPSATTTPVPMEIKSHTPSDMPTLMALPTQTTRTPTHPPMIQPTSIRTIPVTPATTLTPLPTVDAALAREAITAYLHDASNCQLPCFLGILPGETTIAEAQGILAHEGLPIKMNTFEGKDIYNLYYDFDTGLTISVNLIVQDDVVRNMQIGITPEITLEGSPRTWVTFSPETLINHYGQPSRVGFLTDWGPRPLFTMYIYYDAIDLIVEYAAFDLISRENMLVCPLSMPFEDVWVWMGKEPFYPPPEAVWLEQATTMTMAEFSQRMTGDPDQACFTLTEAVIPVMYTAPSH